MKTEALIIGAGPYGIAVAQELWQRGIDFRVVGEPFSLWLDHTPSAMTLRSDWRISEIYSRGSRYSLSEYLAASSLGNGLCRLPIEVFRAYLGRVLERLPFAILRQRIRAVDRSGADFRAYGSQGTEMTARALVVATGPGPHRYLPPALRHLPADRIVHSWDFRRIERLRGRSVLVVGGGQSAAEAVAHLRADNRVTWSLRRKPRFRPGPSALPGPLSGPLLALSHRLPPPIRSAVARAACRATVAPDLREVYADSRVEKVFGDAADLGLRATAGRLAGTAGVPFDDIVAATGYRPAVSGLPFLAADLRAALRKRPGLGADFQTSVPGLFLAGAAAEPSFGPAMRLIYGSRLAARRVAAAVAGRDV